MTSPALWISEAEVASLIDMGDAIAALRRGLIQQHRGDAVNMVKTHVAWGHSTLHAIGGVFQASRIAGTKTWAHTEGGASPLLLLFDSDSGRLLAIIEAFALGQLRTGSISGVAADLLARADARVMALIGAGKQSITQIAAVAAVRRLDRVLVWSPTPAKREAFAAAAAKRLNLDVVAVSHLEDATGEADIVTLATRAREPFLGAAQLKAGAHINAVGAIAPDREEFRQDIFPRCAIMAADSPAQVRALSCEFKRAFGDDETAWAGLSPLSDLIAAGATRTDGADLTLFKAMGMGLCDIALGEAVLERARPQGIGRALPDIVRAEPRLSTKPS